MRRDPVYFKFTNLGYYQWIPVDPFEMRIIYDGALKMIDDHDIDAIMVMLNDQIDRLQRRARRNNITPKWVSEALLITALSGTLGMDLPEVMFADDDD